MCSWENLKVVIIGQDPYPNDGEAMGLSFSVPRNIKTPKSLINIYKVKNYLLILVFDKRQKDKF